MQATQVTTCKPNKGSAIDKGPRASSTVHCRLSKWIIYLHLVKSTVLKYSPSESNLWRTFIYLCCCRRLEKSARLTQDTTVSLSCFQNHVKTFLFSCH